jgi:hypothetical protein
VWSWSWGQLAGQFELTTFQDIDDRRYSVSDMN